MAIVTRREVVCDEGRDRCDNNTLHNISMTIDGKKATRVVCTKHAAPYLRLQEKMGPTTSRARGRVYTPDEIARRRKAKA